MELDECEPELYTGREEEELFVGRELTACEPLPFELTVDELRVEEPLLVVPVVTGRVVDALGRPLTACEPFERVDAPADAPV